MQVLLRYHDWEKIMEPVMFEFVNQSLVIPDEVMEQIEPWKLRLKAPPCEVCEASLFTQKSLKSRRVIL